MLELPEAAVLAAQINQTLNGRRITRATAAFTPHKFAWYSGDPAEYSARLAGRTLGPAAPFGCTVETEVEDWLLVVSTGLRYQPPGEPPPKKHQLLLEFEDGSATSATIQMWGALLCFPPGQPEGMSLEYVAAKRCPSPLNPAFDKAYFDHLFDENSGKLSLKAFLATEQRIPGLGNGVLQDILWKARLHPKRKVATLDGGEIERLFAAIKTVLRAMADQGGRDTERDLFGNPGGYQTVLSKLTVDTPCPTCGTLIRKEAYLGGSIYVCEGCQGTG